MNVTIKTVEIAIRDIRAELSKHRTGGCDDEATERVHALNELTRALYHKRRQVKREKKGKERGK